MAPKPDSSSGKAFSGLEAIPGIANSLRFQIDDVDVSVVNAIRRIGISEVETAVLYYDPYDSQESTVKIVENTGSLHNEFLGHRISLIPLHFDENELHDIVTGSRFRFQLKVHNTGNEIRPVHTKDFVVYDDGGKVLDDEQKAKYLPADPITKSHILITRLKPNISDAAKGEMIHLEASPKIGKGAKNACWSPVSLCVFSNRVDTSAAQAAFEKKIAEVNEARATESKPGLTPPEVEEYRKRFFIMDAQRYFYTNEYGEPSSFVFSIESVCGLSPAYIVFESLRILETKLTDFARKLTPTDSVVSMTESKTVVVKRHNEHWEVTVANEGHTLGNVVQSLVYSLFVPGTFTYIGYYQSHPLEESVTFKLKHKDADADEKTLRADFASSVTSVQKYVRELALQWVDASGLSKKKLRAVDEYLSPASKA